MSAGAGPSGAVPAAASVAPLADEPIAEHQAALLDLAFDAVTRMPSMPHIKDRSRAQEAVVSAYLELGQPQDAARCIDAIENWRRGTAWADLAAYCVERGATAQARQYLTQAQQVAEVPDDAIPAAESPQGWRRDRVRAKIARTLVHLGQPEEAARFELDLADAERGEIEAARAGSAEAAACDEQIAELDRRTAAGGFEEIEAGLQASAVLHDRFYADAELRSRLQDAMERACQKVPRQVRIELLMDLAEQALEHEDTAPATELLRTARTVLDEARWELDDRTPLVSRLAVLRFRSGDEEGARADLDAALAEFEQGQGGLNGIRQARAIRPLAEACCALTAQSKALELYGQAVELGAENPNARPRAEELAATCCSMALRDVQPDAELWARMQQIGAGLDAPW